VTRGSKLVGIVTEHDLLIVASHLLESYLATKD
jgi:CBS domain-containing protein